ncbi:transketolase [Helicobacter sp. faydin-H20]|uniref:transketolase n=1 Tax=Helicobacter anatolicus TaxID=2905874 RepID=UPI001E309020|nr:transketolase [Helicobacter anatolicus]MCE3036691.1 transketolase [Helicobacter anatolicus]
MNISKQDLPLLSKMSNTLKFLCADMVQSANSGHPGVAMGLSDVMSVLSLHLNINPKNPTWINRDRLVFSGGHASSLVYALLHLWGFDVSLEDLKAFRQKDSKTPGHPEFGHTQGVEITTGPLGQGVANAVGFAMGAKYAQNQFGEMINHKVYCMCGDGDLQEGISYEASSLAGHLGLDNLILIYDSNHITIEGDTNIAISENIKMRFEAQGFFVLECDGHDLLEIDAILSQAKTNQTKPVLIIMHTKIAKDAIGLEGSAKAHGAPLGQEVIKKSKVALGFDAQKEFYIPEDVMLRFRNICEKGVCANKIWEDTYKEKIAELQAYQNKDFSKIIYPTFEKGQKVATRVSNGKILNAISSAVAGFIGGSADLSPSNNTGLDQAGDFPNGKNIHFGIREHSMGAISNGLANYGLYLPFCATFFVFSDYLSPSIRIASIMNAKVFYIFTHDSIGVGEDGATHQPIEQLSHFRAMPNLSVYRPADANENIACWKDALERQGPSMFVLSRQNLEVCTPENNDQVKYGGYILKARENAKITLLASGSEVSLALRSAEKLEEMGIIAQVISVPCLDILLKQDKAYIKNLFKDTKVLAIEAARSYEWYYFADDVLMMEGFGSSAKGDELFEFYGFSEENIIERVRALC